MNEALFDFSDLRKNKDDLSNRTFDQLSQNQALLKAFEELREKLKLQSRQINVLKDELKIANVKCRQSEEVLSATCTNNIELKEKVAALSSQNQELKKKLTLMKEATQSQSNYYQQVQFTKQALLEMKTHTDMLTQQRQKLLEISLTQKLNFEEEVNRLKSKIESDAKYIEELEGTYSKSKETILKQENQIKKISISFEEQLFNKNWSKDNFQTQHLLNTIKELEKDIAALKAKNKKQKQKRVILEDKIIELQELSGFHNVKAETFEGEIDMITKKYAKLDKKYQEAKQKLDKISSEKLAVEEQLTKVVFQNEEFIRKLKELSVPQINALIQQSQNKLAFISHKQEELHESISCIQASTSKFIDRATALEASAKQNNANYFSFQPYNSKFLQEQPRVLTEHRKNTASKQETKATLYGSNMTFGQCEEQQNTQIQNRIRRQREQMQRKMKQKILSRKLQACAPADQFKLRGDYIKTFLNQRY